VLLASFTAAYTVMYRNHWMSYDVTVTLCI